MTLVRKDKTGGFLEVRHYKDLLIQLVSRDLKLKYRRSVLGYVWSVLNPLLIMLVMYVVFSKLFDRIGDDGVLKNTLTQDMDRIRRTLEEIDPKAFDRAIEKICSARRIYILGAMSSSILARFLDYNFQLIFDNVHFVQAINTSGIYQQIIHMNSEDAFIAISFPRYSQSTIKATAYAKKCNANVVAITDSVTSPLAAYANELLIARSDMASFADSLVAPLSLLNAIIVAVSARNKDNIEQTFGKLEKLWEENQVYKKDV